MDSNFREQLAKLPNFNATLQDLADQVKIGGTPEEEVREFNALIDRVEQEYFAPMRALHSQTEDPAVASCVIEGGPFQSLDPDGYFIFHLEGIGNASNSTL